MSFARDAEGSDLEVFLKTEQFLLEFIFFCIYILLIATKGKQLALLTWCLGILAKSAKFIRFILYFLCYCRWLLTDYWSSTLPGAPFLQPLLSISFLSLEPPWTVTWRMSGLSMLLVPKVNATYLGLCYSSTPPPIYILVIYRCLIIHPKTTIYCLPWFWGWNGLGRWFLFLALTRY